MEWELEEDVGLGMEICKAVSMPMGMTCREGKLRWERNGHVLERSPKAEVKVWGLV